MSAELRCKPRSKVVSKAKKLKCLRCLKIGHSSIQCPNWFATNDTLLPPLGDANIHETKIEENCKKIDMGSEQNEVKFEREKSEQERENEKEESAEKHSENREEKYSEKERVSSEVKRGKNRVQELCEEEKKLSDLASKNEIESEIACTFVARDSKLILLNKNIITNVFDLLWPSVVLPSVQVFRDFNPYELHSTRGNERIKQAELCCLHEGKIQLHMEGGKYGKKFSIFTYYDFLNILQSVFLVLKKYTLFDDFKTFENCFDSFKRLHEINVNKVNRNCVILQNMNAKRSFHDKYLQIDLFVNFRVIQSIHDKAYVINSLDLLTILFLPTNDLHDLHKVYAEYELDISKKLFLKEAEERYTLHNTVNVKDSNEIVSYLQEFVLLDVAEIKSFDPGRTCTYERVEFDMKSFDLDRRFLSPTADSRTNPFEERENDTKQPTQPNPSYMHVRDESFTWDPGIL